MTKAQQARFRRLVAGLNALLTEVRVDVPEANYYLNNDTLCLLSASSHEAVDGRAAVPRRDRVLVAEQLHHSGGGGW